MNKPVFFAAMVAALPLCAAAQEAKPPAVPAGAPPQTGCPNADEAPRASSALPARASTIAEPQLGSVAASGRVLSHAETPSMRAMRAARAKDVGPAPHITTGTGTDCAASPEERTLRESEQKD